MTRWVRVVSSAGISTWENPCTLQPSRPTCLVNIRPAFFFFESSLSSFICLQLSITKLDRLLPSQLAIEIQSWTGILVPGAAVTAIAYPIRELLREEVTRECQTNWRMDKVTIPPRVIFQNLKTIFIIKGHWPICHQAAGPQCLLLLFPMTTFPC